MRRVILALTFFLFMLFWATSVYGQGVNIGGTTSSTFTLNAYDVSSSNQYIYFNRGAFLSDAYFGWDEGDDSFILSHPWYSLLSRRRIVCNDIATFTDGDTTPSVGNVDTYKTGNTAPTTIDMFDNGLNGQVITVIFKDAVTTIDFTGSHLIGNGGSDWTATANDMMVAIFDGSDWYCDVAGGGGGGDATTLNGLASSQFLRSDTSDSFTSGTLSIDDGTILDVAGTLKIADTNDSHRMSLVWNEDAVANRILNVGLGGGDRNVTFNEDFITGDGYGGTLTYSASTKTLIVEDDTSVNQDLTTDAAVGFAGLTLTGKLIQKADTFVDTDTTPSVAGGNVFKTANTIATAINDFDSGAAGQCIVVIVNDDYTTFDFSSTNLKGNAGVDWSANQSDTVFAAYDGTYWWCDISITTSDLSSGSVTGITLVKCDASGGSYTYSVPTAVGKNGEMYVIVKSDVSTNVVTVDPNGSETMNGALTYRLSRRYATLSLVSDNANWTIATKSPPCILNVRDFGATGDGVTNDYPAIQAAITAAAKSDTIYFPTGSYILNSGAALSVTKWLNIVGDGVGSLIYQKGDVDLFNLYLAASISYIRISDLWLKSDATTPGTALLDMTYVCNSTFENITMTGAYYGIYGKGMLRNSFWNIRTKSDDITNDIEWLVYLDDDGAGHESNANSFYGVHARGGVQVCDNGIYFDGGGEGNINIHGGAFEGTDGIGIQIISANCGSSIIGCHFEGDLIDYGIVITSSQQISIENCYLTGLAMTAITMSNARNINITGCYITSGIDSVVAAGNCTNVLVEYSRYKVVPRMYGTNCIVSNCSSYTTTNVTKTGGRNTNYVNLIDGNLEAWTSYMPIGLSLLSTTYPTKTGDGLGDTNKKFGSYAAKVTCAATKDIEGLGLTLTGDKLNRLIRPRRYNYADKNTAWSWTLSTATGSSPNYNYEYYLRKVGGTNPYLPNEPLALMLNGGVVASATVGALTAGTWDYGDNDSLGYNTIYVRLSDNTDPDTKTEGYVEAILGKSQVTMAGWFKKPYTAGMVGWIGARSVGVESLNAYVDGTYIYSDDNVGDWTRLTYVASIDPRTTTLYLGYGLKGSIGTEKAPALTDGNWTVGSGWQSPIVGPGLIKNADGVGTQTPSAATNIAAGARYEVRITLSAWSVGSATYTLGGVAGSTLSAATTYTDYITTTTTGKLIITPTNTSRFTISSISIKTNNVSGLSVYMDGLELYSGNVASANFEDGLSVPDIGGGSFRVPGNILRSSVVSTMTGSETFTWGQAEIYIKDTGAANRNFNPSGSFPQGAMVHIVNTNASYNIYFDSTVLNYTIAPNKGGIFVYTGTVWKTVATY